MSDVAGWPTLGALPLQDHRDLPPERRMVPMAGRVVGRDREGRISLEGHTGADGAEKSLGDLGLGSTLWPVPPEGGRKIPAWFLAAPAVTTAAVPASGPPSGTTTAGASARAGRFLPAHDAQYGPDVRFRELAASVPAGQALPAGHPAVIIGATDERRQLPLAFPAAPPIVAVHHAGNPQVGSLVHDLTAGDRIDPARAARLHALTRVALLDGGKGLSSGPTLVWRMRPDVQGTSGQGLVDGLSGGAAPPQQPGNVPAAAPGGGIAIALPEPAPPNDTVLAALAHRGTGGPIDVGGPSDVHQLGKTKDGEGVNAAHISTEALYRTPNGSRDATLEFGGLYQKGQRFPFLAPTYLRYDPAAGHKWGGGSGPGLWRWQTEVPIYVEKKRKPPPPLPPPPPKPDPEQEDGPPPFLPLPPEGGRGPRVQTGGSLTGPTPPTTPGGGGVGDGGTGGGGSDGSQPTGSLTGPQPPTVPGGGESIFGDDFDTQDGTQFGPPESLLDDLDGDETPDSEPEEPEAPTPTESSYPSTPLCTIFGGNVWYRALSTSLGAGDYRTIEGVAAVGAEQVEEEMAGRPVVAQTIAMGPAATTVPADGAPASADGTLLLLPGDVDGKKVITGETTVSPTGQTGKLGLVDGMSAVTTGTPNETTGQLDGGTTWSADGKVITFESDTHTFEVDLASGEARMDGVPLGTGGGGSAGALPGGTGADGDYDPADGASLAAGLPNYDDYTLQAGRTVKGNAGQFHYVQVAGNAALNGTINLDGRGNEGGNGGAGGASSAAGNGTNGTAGSAGTGTKAATAGGGARGGGSGSGDGATRSGGNGGTGGTGGNRGAPWSADGQGTGGAGTAGGTGAGSAGTLGGNATAVNPTLLARRVSHDFLVALLGGAGGGGGGGGGGYAAGTVVAAGGAGASTYADADGTGEDGADGTFSVDSSGGGGGGKGGRGGGVYVMVVRGNVSGTFTINARGAQGGNGGVGNATGGDGGAGGGGGGGFCLVVFYGTWSATLTCNVGGGDSPAGQGAGEDGFYAVVNGSTGEVVQWGGSLASIAERTSALVAVQPTVSAAPADPLVATAPTTLVPVDTSGGAFAVELPPADSVEVGDSLILKDTGGAATANPLTVDANAADTIDGGASTSLGVDSGAITIQKITANTWMIV